MTRKKQSVLIIQSAPILHTTLPQKLIERIKAYKNILAEVEDSSLEEAIEDFKRDDNPEIEVALWEHIARVYQTYVTEKSILILAVKKEVFAVLVAHPMGFRNKVLKNLRHLNKEEVGAIIDLFGQMKINPK